jgi:ABC-2 type transport system permease protein
VTAPTLTAAVLNALWRSAVMQLRLTFTTPVAVVVGIVQPVAFIGIATLGRTAASAGTTGQVVVGGALLSLWSSVLWSAGSILRRERYAGTLAAVLARPTPFWVVLCGKTVGATAASGSMVLFSTALICTVLDRVPALAAPVIAVPGIALCCLSAALLGMIISCLTLLTRAAARVIEALTYPVFVFGGLIIPLSELPEPLRRPSALLSFRWAVQAVTDTSGPATAPMLALIALTGAYAVGAGCCTALTLRRVRREATIDLT